MSIRLHQLQPTPEEALVMMKALEAYEPDSQDHREEEYKKNVLFDLRYELRELGYLPSNED